MTMRLLPGRRKINILLMASLAFWIMFALLFTNLVFHRSSPRYIDYSKIHGAIRTQILHFEPKKITRTKQTSNSTDIRVTTVKTTIHEQQYHPNIILANNTICDRKLDLLVYIQSHWRNFMRRRILRNTWASKSTFTKVNMSAVFFLGRPDKTDDQIKINNEQLINGDIIEADVLESHQNISLKSKIAMNWIHSHCSNARFVLKTDDDIFVNIFEIFEHILPTIDSKKKIIACHVKENGTSIIVRNKNSKWYVPETVFPNMTTFPRFCTGYAVVMTTTLVEELYKVSKQAPVIPVDDVYMFGVLTQPVTGIKFINLQDRFTLSQERGLNAYSEGDTKTFLVVAAPGTGAMEELWSYTLLDLSTWARNNSKIVLEE